MSYQKQLELEQSLSRANVNKWILEEIMSEAVFTTMFVRATELIEAYLSKNDYYASKQKRINFLTDKMNQNGLYIDQLAEQTAIELFACVLPINNGKRTNEPIQGVATNLGLRLGYTNQLDAVKTGAELLAVCEPCGLYEIQSAFSPEHDHDTATVVPKYMLSDDLIHKIHLTQYMPPMLHEPLQWHDTAFGGHLLNQSAPVLGHGNYVGQHVCFDVLNKLQSIAWTLNETMLCEEELPKEPLDMSDPLDLRKAKQHNERVIQSKRVYDLMLNEGNHFFFVWKYDKRGRMYSQGYDINLQGSEYKKATIEFANQEPLTGV